MKGFAALSTAFGVGELSALNGIAGSYTEHLPVFHLAGMPNTKTQRERRLVHHTLGNGEFDVFLKMSRPAVCASAILTPENAAVEVERLIAAALAHRRPVHLGIPADCATAPVLPGPRPWARTRSPPPIRKPSRRRWRLLPKNSTKPKPRSSWQGYLIPRLGCTAQAMALVEATGLPFATMFMDKTALDETHPQYIGMYDGRIMNQDIREFVEGCDCVLNLGALWSDLNTGAFTANIDPARMISVRHHYVQVGRALFPDIEMCDALVALAGKVSKKQVPAPKVHGLGDAPGGSPMTRLRRITSTRAGRSFFRPGDLVVAETGTVSMGLAFALMPRGSVFLNQTLWCSIGWGTPAALGAALAAPGKAHRPHHRRRGPPDDGRRRSASSAATASSPLFSASTTRAISSSGCSARSPWPATMTWPCGITSSSPGSWAAPTGSAPGPPPTANWTRPWKRRPPAAPGPISRW